MNGMEKFKSLPEDLQEKILKMVEREETKKEREKFRKERATLVLELEKSRENIIEEFGVTIDTLKVSEGLKNLISEKIVKLFEALKVPGTSEKRSGGTKTMTGRRILYRGEYWKPNSLYREIKGAPKNNHGLSLDIIEKDLDMVLVSPEDFDPKVSLH